MLPESFILILFCWGIAIVMLILGDTDIAFDKNWPNIKMKLIGILFATFSSVLSVIPQRYDIATSSNTVQFYNQTVDVSVFSPTSGTPIDFTRFVISILVTVLCCADFLITLIEDPV